ncbi:MAG TPA: hypothetical protein VK919_15140 [Solirubrobacterales bacterium]|nr:hypothetical protein [Solirubrobacterales bacterium]
MGTPILAAVLPEAIEPYLVLMIAGFVVAITGHLAGSRWLVAAGVLMIFLAAVLFPIALQFLADEPPPPGPRVPPVGPG